jgi:hypothetical protein
MVVACQSSDLLVSVIIVMREIGRAWRGNYLGAINPGIKESLGLPVMLLRQ